MKTHLIPIGAIAAQVVLVPQIRRRVHGHTMPAPFVGAAHKFNRMEAPHLAAPPALPSTHPLPARLAPGLKAPLPMAKHPPAGTVCPSYHDRAIFRTVVSAVVWG